jgi:hypothetical protein
MQYILTWISLGVLLISGVGLLAVSWNGSLSGEPSPSLMTLLWMTMSASGIYLFMLAVKKAHRLMINEERRRKDEETPSKELSRESKSNQKDNKSLDFSATARKLVRKIQEETPMEQMGEDLLKQLAKELEIMSGIFYVRNKNLFQAVSSYALANPREPYSFEEGEGLSGQAAANRQIMMLTNLPEEHLEVYSGLGKARPSYLAIVPLIHKEKTIAVLECSGYRYAPGDIESMFRIFSRDLMEKLSPHIK